MNNVRPAMENVNLKLNTTFELVGVAPLKLAGRSGEGRFTILEVDNGYLVTGPDWDDYDEVFFTLKEAIQQCYLNWGEFLGAECIINQPFPAP